MQQEQDMEQVYKNWTEMLAGMVVTMLKAGEEVAGETYLRKLEEKFFENGKAFGTHKCAQLGEKGTDCMAIGRVMDAIDQSMANYWDGYVENSATGFEKHVKTCPAAEIFAQAPEMCSRLVQAMGQGLVSFINPDATFQMNELLVKGDDSCHYRIEIRKPQTETE